MPADCAACGISFHKTTDIVKCAGKCGLHYHSVCTNLRTQEELTMLSKKKTQWVCNYCRFQFSDTRVQNVNDSSQANKDIEPNISDLARSMMDEFADLRIRIKLISKKLNKLETDINNIKTEHTDAKRVTESLRRRNKDSNNYINNSMSYMSGRQESDQSYVVKSTVTLSPDENTSKVMKIVAESMERFLYLLAVLTLFFVAKFVASEM